MTYTPEERAAIAAWLADNEPAKYPMGYSGIYDKIGRKRSGRRFFLASLSKRIRRMRRHKTMTCEEIAVALKVRIEDIQDCVKNHQIEVRQ